LGEDPSVKTAAIISVRESAFAKRSRMKIRSMKRSRSKMKSKRMTELPGKRLLLLGAAKRQESRSLLRLIDDGRGSLGRGRLGPRCDGLL
jgi:hypothetical protein